MLIKILGVDLGKLSCHIIGQDQNQLGSSLASCPSHSLV